MGGQVEFGIPELIGSFCNVSLEALSKSLIKQYTIMLAMVNIELEG